MELDRKKISKREHIRFKQFSDWLRNSFSLKLTRNLASIIVAFIWKTLGQWKHNPSLNYGLCETYKISESENRLISLVGQESLRQHKSLNFRLSIIFFPIWELKSWLLIIFRRSASQKLSQVPQILPTPKGLVSEEAVLVT